MLLVECVASLFPLRPRIDELPAGATTVLLVPAHDESASIVGTVAALQEDLGPGDRIVVVADNCTDDTAERAKAAGALAIERHDPDRRGKGYALRFGVEWLESNPPSAVVVVDADCRLQPGSIRLLAAQALTLDRPVQAEYTFVPLKRTPLSMVSTLALLVRNRVRPRGLRRLGLPCQLTGSGMAFPWPTLRDAPALRCSSESVGSTGNSGCFFDTRRRWSGKTPAFGCRARGSGRGSDGAATRIAGHAVGSLDWSGRRSWRSRRLHVSHDSGQRCGGGGDARSGPCLGALRSAIGPASLSNRGAHLHALENPALLVVFTRSARARVAPHRTIEE